MTLRGLRVKSIVNINKDTAIYGSFSQEPGNFGCEFHNKGFQVLRINAIYKSFKIFNIRHALDAMRTLDIKGAAVSMPHKVDVVKFVDEISPEVEVIGAANTLVQDVDRNGSIKALNTDYIAAREYLAALHTTAHLHILGNGGYSKAVQYACIQLEMDFTIYDRDNWDNLYRLRNELIFNCTPQTRDWVRPHESCEYIDCLITTETGQQLSTIQAKAQFKIYTGQDYPDV